MPDLENICKTYLDILNNITESHKTAIGGGLIKIYTIIMQPLIKNTIG